MYEPKHEMKAGPHPSLLPASLVPADSSHEGT